MRSTTARTPFDLYAHVETLNALNSSRYLSTLAGPRASRSCGWHPSRQDSVHTLGDPQLVRPLLCLSKFKLVLPSLLPANVLLAFSPLTLLAASGNLHPSDWHTHFTSFHRRPSATSLLSVVGPHPSYWSLQVHLPPKSLVLEEETIHGARSGWRGVS
jgi:hypothetical protein